MKRTPNDKERCRDLFVGESKVATPGGVQATNDKERERLQASRSDSFEEEANKMKNLKQIKSSLTQAIFESVRPQSLTAI